MTIRALRFKLVQEIYMQGPSHPSWGSWGASLGWTGGGMRPALPCPDGRASAEHCPTVAG